jgi:O-antigen ligase
MLGVLLTLIFIRPFISSLAFPYLNSLYSALFLVFLITRLIYKGISIKKIPALKYPLILFSLALIISVVFSTDKLNSLKELYKYISGILLLLIVASLTYKDKIYVIHTIIFAGLIISLLAIYQYFFGFQHILNYITKEKISEPFVLDYVSRKRVFFPFVTPNTLGGYLAMIIPLALINKNRIWFIIPVSFALLLTKSLGALLSIFLALAIYFYLPRPCAQERGLQGKLDKRKVIFLLGLLIAIGVVFITRAATGKQHLQPIFSTVMRLNYWKDTLRIIKASPLAGVGLGNFNLEQSRYAHNSYLQIWAEMGILGIIAWMWIIFESLRTGFKKLKLSENQNYTLAALLSANFTFLIHNLIDFSFFLSEVSWIWWIILGLIIH